MADFALWATACEPGHSPAGTFMRAYGSSNRAATVDTVLEADPVAGAIMKLMEKRATGPVRLLNW